MEDWYRPPSTRFEWLKYSKVKHQWSKVKACDLHGSSRMISIFYTVVFGRNVSGAMNSSFMSESINIIRADGKRVPASGIGVREMNLMGVLKTRYCGRMLRCMISRRRLDTMKLYLKPGLYF